MQLESVGSREVDVAWRTRERAESVETRDVVLLVEYIVPVELQLHVAHFVI